MDKFIIEKVEKCKLVSSHSEVDGHDCWGNTEFNTYDVVMLNGKIERVFKGQYICHDGKKIIHVGRIYNLPIKFQRLFDKTVDEKLKKEKYDRYLKLKEEVERENKVNRVNKVKINVEDPFGEDS